MNCDKSIEYEEVKGKKSEQKIEREEKRHEK